MVNDLCVPVSNAFCPNLSLNHPPSLPNLHTFEFKILLMTFKAIHGMAPDYLANWSAEKEINWIFPQIQRKSYAWGSKRQADTPNTWWQSILLCGPKDGPTYLAKNPALTLCQILNAIWKHIFWNKLLICSSVFVSFIVLFITYYY